MLKFRFSGKYNLLFCAFFFLFLCAGGIYAQQTGDGLFARITTNRGDIIVRLDFERAPLTVCNFVALAEGKMNVTRGRHYYDGLTFHHVISRANGDEQDFIIKGGDPLGNDRGGPGYSFPDEIDPTLRHDSPGILSMANAGPDTNGSQFFITIVPAPHLDGLHTVFGRVVNGQDVVNSIRKGDRIERITIIRNGYAANIFKADQEAFDILLRRKEVVNAGRIYTQRLSDIRMINDKFQNTELTDSGIRYIIQKQGNGDKPLPGFTVRVNIKGSLLSGQYFDNSDLRGGYDEFLIGTGNIFQGFDETILDMKTGEKRLVIIPPELGYGSMAIGNSLIPANSFLVFEIELVSILQ